MMIQGPVTGPGAWVGCARPVRKGGYTLVTLEATGNLRV